MTYANYKTPTPISWSEAAKALAAQFELDAEHHDRLGQFVHKNYDLLREKRFFSIGIPGALGGGGVDYGDICNILQTIAGGCGSTALAYAMHLHPVAVNIFKHRHGDNSATKALQRIAENELIIAGTGANDWLNSSGRAEKVKGGYQVNAHKHFVSGGPGADLFVTSAIDTSTNAPEVIHFTLPMDTEGVTISDNWDTLGMRATGSNDILLKNVFVADEAIVGRRPQGVWHPLWDTVLPLAMPMIVAVYLGLGEKAFHWVVSVAQKVEGMEQSVGKAHNELTVARLAHQHMVRMAANHEFEPNRRLTDAILTRKTLATKALQNLMEIATAVVGGPGFFKGHPLELVIRDSRAMPFHPMPEQQQQCFSGQFAIRG